MNVSDAEVMRRARSLKPSVQNPFESFGFTLLMLLVFPLYFVPYEWEIYLADTDPARQYADACTRWQRIAVMWCIAVMFVIFHDLDHVVGQAVAMIVKVCLSTTFSLYVFSVFVFGFMIDFVTARYRDRMVEFGLRFHFLMGVTIPAFAIGTLLITVAVVAFMFGAFHDSNPWAFYFCAFVVLSAQLSWFSAYAVFVKDAWLPIRQAHDELYPSAAETG